MLNYKHLYYMREAATAGSITRASERLHLTPQTISGQISQLEESLGCQLFHRNGRTLELTEAGVVALKYADEIFQLGAELEGILQHYPKNRLQSFRVGVSDLVPKSIAYQLLEPAMFLNQRIRIVCSEGKLDDLLAELAVHRMDLVIADSPIPSNMNIKGFSHKLGSSSISFFATAELCDSFKKPFPRCLEGTPMLIPSEGAAIRQPLMNWLHENRLHPVIVGEFDDNALMKAFGQAGTGIFMLPSALEKNLQKEGKAKLIGRAKQVRESFYAISIEKRIKHPAVKAITDHAQDLLRSSEQTGET